MADDYRSDGTIEPEANNEAERLPEAQIADASAKAACKELEEGVKARAARFLDIQKNEAQYNGEKTKALRGRHNIPFDQVVARGYVDTLFSKIDEKLQISFDRSPGRQQDKKAAQKITAVCDFERGPDQGAWDIKDLGSKKLAIFSGRAILKKFSARGADGEFHDHLEVVDHWDFVTEAKGGGFLDTHLYKGQMNILRARSQILENAEAGIYDKRQAYKLFKAQTDTQAKKNDELFKYKVHRAEVLGIDFQANAYTPSQMYNLVEWVHFFRGSWYYLVFDYATGIWLRHEKLEDVFSVAKRKTGRGPWISWATHFDPFVFWTIGPMDSVRPIATAMKKVANFALDSIEKRTWQNRAYDPNVFNPKDLTWRDNGLAKANVRQGQSIANAVHTFETADTSTITVNMTEWLDNFLGRQTGITADAKGKSDEDKVGIYFGNMEQVADRLGLTNKMYEQAHVEIGVNFQYGLLDHMPERYAVKVIGNSGVEWDEELLRKELDQKFVVRIRGSNAEEKMNAALSARKESSLAMIAKDPELRQRTNASWRLRQTLQLGGFDTEEIAVALDTQNDADDDILSEAAGAIEEILDGRIPEKNRGATTAYIRKIVNFAYDTNLDKRTFDRLIKFAELHIPIAKENAARKVQQVAIAARTSSLLNGGGAGPVKSPMQPSPDGEIREEVPAPPAPGAGGGAY